jgi:hypothetical protein
MQKTLYYLKGTRIMSYSLDEKKKTETPSKVFDYDETLLYHLFILSVGSVTGMLGLANSLSDEEQAKIPCRATIYNIIKRKGWKDKIKEVKDAFDKDAEEYGSMSYVVINKIAGIVQSLYFKKVIDMAKREDFASISDREFRLFWEILRTERGLVSRVTGNNAMDMYSYRKMLDKRFNNLDKDSKFDVELLVKHLCAMPEEYSLPIINILSGKPPDEPPYEPPPMLTRNQRADS